MRSKSQQSGGLLKVFRGLKGRDTPPRPFDSVSNAAGVPRRLGGYTCNTCVPCHTSWRVRSHHYNSSTNAPDNSRPLSYAICVPRQQTGYTYSRNDRLYTSWRANSSHRNSSNYLPGRQPWVWVSAWVSAAVPYDPNVNSLPADCTCNTNDPLDRWLHVTRCLHSSSNYSQDTPLSASASAWASAAVAVVVDPHHRRHHRHCCYCCCYWGGASSSLSSPYAPCGISPLQHYNCNNCDPLGTSWHVTPSLYNSSNCSPGRRSVYDPNAHSRQTQNTYSTYDPDRIGWHVTPSHRNSSNYWRDTPLSSSPSADPSSSYETHVPKLPSHYTTNTYVPHHTSFGVHRHLNPTPHDYTYTCRLHDCCWHT